MEIQFSIDDGIHRKWPYYLPTWDQKVIQGPLINIYFFEKVDVRVYLTLTLTLCIKKKEIRFYSSLNQMVGEIIFKNPIWFSQSSNLFYYFTTLVITRTCTWEIIEQQVINLGGSSHTILLMLVIKYQQQIIGKKTRIYRSIFLLALSGAYQLLELNINLK